MKGLKIKSIVSIAVFIVLVCFTTTKIVEASYTINQGTIKSPQFTLQLPIIIKLNDSDNPVICVAPQDNTTPSVGAAATTMATSVENCPPLLVGAINTDATHRTTYVKISMINAPITGISKARLKSPVLDQEVYLYCDTTLSTGCTGADIHLGKNTVGFMSPAGGTSWYTSNNAYTGGIPLFSSNSDVNAASNYLIVKWDLVDFNLLRPGYYKLGLELETVYQ